MEGRPEADENHPFSVTLRALMEQAINPETGRPYTRPEICAAIWARVKDFPEPERTRRTIGPTYLWQLKSGVRTNPSGKTIQSLAEFFGVDVNVFIGGSTIPADFAARQAMHDVAFRASELSPEALEPIIELLQHAKQLDQRSAGGRRAARKRGAGDAKKHHAPETGAADA